MRFREFIISQLTSRNIKASAVAFAAIWIFILLWRIVGVIGKIQISDSNLNNIITTVGVIMVALISLHNNILARRSERMSKENEKSNLAINIALDMQKWLLDEQSKKMEITQSAVIKTQDSVVTLTEHTNGIQAALVDETRKAAFKRGVDQGLESGPDAVDTEK